MSLKVKDIEDIMEKFAPLELKESYDNVGLMVGDSEDEIKSVLISLDCTLDVIDEAINKGCNLILTHHPILFIKPSSITTKTLIGRKIIKLIQNDINVYSSHTNLDSTVGGLNDTVAKLLGFDKWQVIEPTSIRKPEYRSTGIGRVVTFDNPVTLDELCSRIKSVLGISCLRYSGADDMLITKLAIINGSGQDYFYDAQKMGADCILTGDTTYHHVSDFEELGIGVIDAGHFHTEWPPLKAIANYIKDEIKKIDQSVEVYISECSKSPYKYK